MRSLSAFGMTGGVIRDDHSPRCHLDHRERSLFSSFPTTQHSLLRALHSYLFLFPQTPHRHHDEIPPCVRDDRRGVVRERSLFPSFPQLSTHCSALRTHIYPNPTTRSDTAAVRAGILYADHSDQVWSVGQIALSVHAVTGY